MDESIPSLLFSYFHLHVPKQFAYYDIGGRGVHQDLAVHVHCISNELQYI
jgi:hypothetical protein